MTEIPFQKEAKIFNKRLRKEIFRESRAIRCFGGFAFWLGALLSLAPLIPLVEAFILLIGFFMALGLFGLKDTLDFGEVHTISSKRDHQKNPAIYG